MRTGGAMCRASTGVTNRRPGTLASKRDSDLAPSNAALSEEQSFSPTPQHRTSSLHSLQRVQLARQRPPNGTLSALLLSLSKVFCLTFRTSAVLAPPVQSAAEDRHVPDHSWISFMENQELSQTLRHCPNQMSFSKIGYEEHWFRAFHRRGANCPSQRRSPIGNTALRSSRQSEQVDEGHRLPLCDMYSYSYPNGDQRVEMEMRIIIAKLPVSGAFPLLFELVPQS